MKGLHCTPAAPGQLDIARLYPQASAESARVSFLYSKVIKSLYHDYYPVALSRHPTRIHCLPLIMLPRRFLVTWILGTSINSNFNRIIWTLVAHLRTLQRHFLRWAFVTWSLRPFYLPMASKHKWCVVGRRGWSMPMTP